MLNARIRKRWRMGAFPIGLIGERADLTYPYDYLGAGPQTLSDVAFQACMSSAPCSRRPSTHW